MRDAIEKMLERHREQVKLTCPRHCFCWDIDSYLSELDAEQEMDGFRAVPNSNLEISETPSSKAVEIRRRR